MLVLILSLISTASIIFMFMNHPLSFGLILLTQTVCISIITGLMNYNYWFSYILFLVMVGGMLILFIYMTSIASNEKFKLSLKMTIFTTMMMMMSTLVAMTLDNMMIENIMNSDLSKFNNAEINQLSLNKYMNWPLNLIMAMIIIYLLITLVMAVKITNIKNGPLRQKF